MNLLRGINMDKKRSGFTIVEVILVLAISLLLMIGLLANVSSRISRQRYTDSVQNFSEYLRSVYSAVINVQNPRADNASNYMSCSLPSQVNNVAANGENHAGAPGRTDCAIYGKLLTINENSKEGSVIREYDVIGDAVNSSSSAYNVDNPTVGGLIRVNADVLALIANGNSTTDCHIGPSGNLKKYLPPWSVSIQEKDGSVFKGAVLIVRSPSSGAIQTFVSHEALAINNIIDSAASSQSCNSASSVNSNKYTLIDALSDGKFKNEDADFCLKSDDMFSLNGERKNIRILADGHNASAVKLVESDSGESRCN